MSDAIKFTNEEMAKIRAIQQVYNEITMRLGQLVMQRVQLESQLAQLDMETSVIKDRFLKTQEEEKEIAKTLQTKYGDGVLNPETGEFRPKATPTSIPAIAPQ